MSSADERREQVGPADRVEDGLPRPIAAGQDEAEGGALVTIAGGTGQLGDVGRPASSRPDEVGRRHGEDHVLAVARAR